MAKTISANTGSVFLSSANPGDDPLSILAGVVVSGGSNGVSADSSRIWDVANYGTVTGSAGVRFSGQGRLTNSGTAARIVGGNYGVYGGGLTTVTNQGSISGSAGFGVLLAGGGKVSNLGAAAQISGAFRGVAAIGAGATLVNQGTVAAISSYAVVFQAGGTVTNATALSRITGGIGISGGAGSISNRGSVTKTSSDAINLAAGGTVQNLGTSAAIAGVTHGVAISGAGTVTNQGTISATGFDAVLLGGGGIVTNITGGAILGHRIGVFGGNAAVTVANAGIIIGTTLYGVDLFSGGVVTNSRSSASIYGGVRGIAVGGSVAGATIVNRGTIGGTVAAVQFGSGGGNLLQVFAGAVFNGAVIGGSGTGDTLELGSSSSAGTISGIGTQFTGFEQINVDAGAAWQMQGANAIPAGTSLRISAGAALKVTGALTMPANMTIAGSGTLAAIGGTIEIGATGGGVGNQIRVDAGSTLSTRGVLKSGVLKVIAGALVVGAGTVTNAAQNAGTIEAKGGVLTVGGNLTGTGTLQADGGATLALGGTVNTAGVVVNRGTIALAATASLQVTGSVDPVGGGVFILDSASLLRVAADTGTGHKIQFLGAAGATLAVDSVAAFGSGVGTAGYAGALLKDFGGIGDAIDLRDLVFAGATIDSYILHGAAPVIGVLQLHSGATTASLAFDNASLTGSAFQLGNDGTGHVLLTHV